MNDLAIRLFIIKVFKHNSLEELSQALYNAYDLVDMEVMTAEEASIMEWLAEYQTATIWASWAFVRNNDKGFEPLFNWLVDDIIKKKNRL